MSNVSYDLDTSGGLMPLIRALIKPPDEEVSTQKSKKTQHPYYKRPGKGHNHDSCNACGEGGDLICCDRCPASFHLGCYDPPLDEHDIPAGLWLCRECRASDDEKPSSARGSRAQSPADKSDTEKKTRSLRNNRTNSKKKSKDDDDKIEEEKPPEKELTPMEVLVKAAKIMNPTQFQLPREMRIPVLFPGTDKEGSSGNGAGAASEGGGVLGAACYVCGGTCRAAPLLQCDYCPLLFHQDCLDPPLTALPTGRWMCPNHVEQFIDWKLVNSISVTERVALWDKFTGPVDQHAIKIDFLRRARNPAPRFRSKLEVCGRPCVRVPGMVRAHYAKPPPLLPSRREHVRCTNVLQRLKSEGIYSETEDDNGEKFPVCVNPVCPSNDGQTCPASQTNSQTDSQNTDNIDNDDFNDVKRDLKKNLGDSSSDLSDSDLEYLTQSVKRRKFQRPASPVAVVKPVEGADELFDIIDHQLRKIDHRLVKLLAWQRLQQVLCGERCGGAYKRCGLSGAGEALARAALGQPGPAPAPAPAPSALLSRADRERIAAAVWGAPPSPPLSPRRAPAPAPAPTCLRAALLPAQSSVGPAVGMRGTVLRVGTGSHCELRLDGTQCRQVSPQHATIFMDEVTRHFELINYSEYGTQVNGVLYACDVTRSPPPAESPPAGDAALPGAGALPAGGLPPGGELDADARADALRDIVRDRMPKPYRINGNLTAPLPSEGSCKCQPPRGARGAWEGSALLPHGAMLQFGCLQYVFSIVDTQTEELEPAL